ncbi:hypothetical protein AX16_005057 [Volvariella volvacea WC 439]|nr:hypothetical protein AX16_005057 [Volvariella volvacea WC 439]
MASSSSTKKGGHQGSNLPVSDVVQAFLDSIKHYPSNVRKEKMREKIAELNQKIEDAREAQAKRRQDHAATIAALQSQLDNLHEQIGETIQSVEVNQKMMGHIQPYFDKYPGLFADRFQLSPEELRGRVTELNRKVEELSLNIVQTVMKTPRTPGNINDVFLGELNIVSQSFIAELNRLRTARYGFPEQAEKALRATIAWSCYCHAESWYLSNPDLDAKFKRIREAIRAQGVALVRYWDSLTNPQLRKIEGPKALEALIDRLSDLIARVLAICGWDFRSLIKQDKRLQTFVSSRVSEIGEMVVALNLSLRQDKRSSAEIQWFCGDSPVDPKLMEFPPNAMSNHVSCTTALGLVINIMHRPPIVMRARVL